MKLLYFSNSPLHTFAANAVHVMKQCDSFAEIGYEVTLYAVSNNPLIDYYSEYNCRHRFGIKAIPRGGIKYFSPVKYAYEQVRSVDRELEPAIIYCRCPLSAFFALIRGCSIIFEAHEVPSTRWLSFIYARILKHKRLLRLIVISNGLKEDLCSRFGLREEQVETLVCHDGASVPINFADEKSLFDPSGYRKVVGYAGGLRDGNGIDLILKLAADRQDVLFVLAGGSAEQIVSWKAECKTRNVIWLGQISPKLVPSFLSQCDILIAPYQPGPKTGMGVDTSRWMSPLKVFEYMASGKPIMISDIPVLREVLSDDTAVLIPQDDYGAWLTALDRLLTEDDYSLCLGDKALNLLINNFTWDRRAYRLLENVEL